MGSAAAKSFQPLYDRLLVQRHDPPNTSKGGIILPEVAKERPKQGTVLVVGAGALTPDGERIPMDVKVGDIVWFTPYAGSEVEIGEETLLVLNQIDVLGVIR